MGNLWLKIKIWTKVAVAALLTIYVLVFVVKNGGRTVQFWYWYNREPETSLLFLVFFAFLIGALCAILVSTTLRTVRQIRELRSRTRTAKLEAEVADMRSKAAMLQTRGGGSGTGGQGGTTTTTISSPLAVTPPSSSQIPDDFHRPA